MNAIRPSVIAIARSAAQPSGVRARSGRSLTSGPASPSDRHDVVAGGDLFGAVVRHGQDGRLARLLEQRQRRAGEADQGVRGDVVGDPEALARRLAEGALQIFPLSERHRVYEDVERAGLAPE